MGAISISNHKRYSVAEISKFRSNFDDIDWTAKPRDTVGEGDEHRLVRVSPVPDCGFDESFVGLITLVKPGCKVNGVRKTLVYVSRDVDGAVFSVDPRQCELICSGVQ